MKEKRKKYNRSFKLNALQICQEKKSLSATERELGIYSGSIQRWRLKALKDQKDQSDKKDLTELNYENKRIEYLQRKIAESEMKFEILKNSAPYLKNLKKDIFTFIEANRTLYPVRMMCTVLDVNRKSYYNWKNGVVCKKQRQKDFMLSQISLVFFASKKRYGSERIAAELQNEGHNICVSTVKKYMKELGLRSKIRN
ncbi:MAG: IS3 family transposase [Flavobacterium nitrogenifigens]|uniref:IS3 family transposase n=1 Tax=Flavobacterium nitrogenifigens TaxID=1617283 RepID=UPI0028080D42|nr:IS3 family transposase [Flavobacterium nitrogenifigens]MDQ8014300.1 IS3 family transposase [Flavobacterium nitrogenifigens]